MGILPNPQTLQSHWADAIPEDTDDVLERPFRTGLLSFKFAKLPFDFILLSCTPESFLRPGVASGSVISKSLPGSIGLWIKSRKLLVFKCNQIGIIGNFSVGYLSL